MLLIGIRPVAFLFAAAVWILVPTDGWDSVQDHFHTKSSLFEHQTLEQHAFCAQGPTVTATLSSLGADPIDIQDLESGIMMENKSICSDERCDQGNQSNWPLKHYNQAIDDGHYWYRLLIVLIGWIVKTKDVFLWLIPLVSLKISKLYESMVFTYPLVTNGATSSLIGATGDILAQTFEMKEERNESANKEDKNYDIRRTIAVGIEGCISGPSLCVIYNIIEGFVPIGNSDQKNEYNPWLAAAFHGFTDSIFLDAIWVGALIVVTGILEGRYRQIRKDFELDYIASVKASWKCSLFFSPLQLLSFRYFPLRLRVLATNIQDLVWSGVISYVAHYNRT